eukprot:gene4222-5200_t
MSNATHGECHKSLEHEEANSPRSTRRRFTCIRGLCVLTLAMVAAAVVYDIALLVTLQAVPVGSVSLPQAVFSFPSGGNVLVQFTLSAENRLLLSERFEVHFPRLDARASVRDPSSGSSGSLDLSITAEGFAVELLSVLNGSAASSTVPISAACQESEGYASSCGDLILELYLSEVPELNVAYCKDRIQRLLDHAMQGQGHAGRGLLHDGGGSSIADEMAALLTTLQPENVLKVGLMCDNLICDFGNAIAETNLNLFVSDHDLVLGLEMGEYLNMSVQAVAAEVTADDEVASAADERVYLLWDVARDGESVSRMEGRLTRSRQQDAATLHVEYWDANHAASVDAGGRAPLLDVYLSGSRASERWSELHSRQLEGDHMRLLARVNQSGEELVDVDMAMGVAVDPDNYWDLFMYAESLAVYEGRRHLEVSNCSAMLNAVDSEDEYAGRMDGVLTCTAQPGVDPSGGLWGTTTVPRRYTLSSEMRLTEYKPNEGICNFRLCEMCFVAEYLDACSLERASGAGPDYPRPYDHAQACSIAVRRAGFLNPSYFQLRAGDVLYVGEERYTGTRAPGAAVDPSIALRFQADAGGAGGGFSICLSDSEALSESRMSMSGGLVVSDAGAELMAISVSFGVGSVSERGDDLEVDMGLSLAVSEAMGMDAGLCLESNGYYSGEEDAMRMSSCMNLTEEGSISSQLGISLAMDINSITLDATEGGEERLHVAAHARTGAGVADGEQELDLGIQIRHDGEQQLEWFEHWSSGTNELGNDWWRGRSDIAILNDKLLESSLYSSWRTSDQQVAVDVQVGAVIDENLDGEMRAINASCHMAADEEAVLISGRVDENNEPQIAVFASGATGEEVFHGLVSLNVSLDHALRGAVEARAASGEDGDTLGFEVSRGCQQCEEPSEASGLAGSARAIGGEAAYASLHYLEENEERWSVFGGGRYADGSGDDPLDDPGRVQSASGCVHYDCWGLQHVGEWRPDGVGTVYDTALNLFLQVFEHDRNDELLGVNYTHTTADTGDRKVLRGTVDVVRGAEALLGVAGDVAVMDDRLDSGVAITFEESPWLEASSSVVTSSEGDASSVTLTGEAIYDAATVVAAAWAGRLSDDAGATSLNLTCDGNSWLLARASLITESLEGTEGSELTLGALYDNQYDMSMTARSSARDDAVSMDVAASISEERREWCQLNWTAATAPYSDGQAGSMALSSRFDAAPFVELESSGRLCSEGGQLRLEVDHQASDLIRYDLIVGLMDDSTGAGTLRQLNVTSALGYDGDEVLALHSTSASEQDDAGIEGYTMDLVVAYEKKEALALHSEADYVPGRDEEDLRAHAVVLVDGTDEVEVTLAARVQDPPDSDPEAKLMLLVEYQQEAIVHLDAGLREDFFASPPPPPASPPPPPSPQARSPPTPSPPPPPTLVTLTLIATIEQDIAAFQDEAFKAEFTNDYLAEVSASADVRPEYVSIESITAGSVVVNSQVTFVDSVDEAFRFEASVSATNHSVFSAAFQGEYGTSTVSNITSTWVQPHSALCTAVLSASVACPRCYYTNNWFDLSVEGGLYLVAIR